MANSSVYCPWPAIQKNLDHSAHTPAQVSPHATNGNKPVAHLSEPCRYSPTHGFVTQQATARGNFAFLFGQNYAKSRLERSHPYARTPSLESIVVADLGSTANHPLTQKLQKTTGTKPVPQGLVELLNQRDMVKGGGMVPSFCPFDRLRHLIETT